MLQNIPYPAPSFTVAREDPVILLTKGEGELFSGVENKVAIIYLFIHPFMH